MTANRLLYDAASDHADWLLANCRLGHTGEGGTDSSARIIAAGYTDSVSAGGEYELGENVGLARSEDEVYSGWLDSAGHYANIIRAGYHEIGIAIRDVSSCDNFYLEEDGTYLDLAATGETWYIYVVNFGRKQPSPWTIIPIELD